MQAVVQRICDDAAFTTAAFGSPPDAAAPLDLSDALRALTAAGAAARAAAAAAVAAVLRKLPTDWRVTALEAAPGGVLQAAAAPLTSVLVLTHGWAAVDGAVAGGGARAAYPVGAGAPRSPVAPASGMFSD